MLRGVCVLEGKWKIKIKTNNTDQRTDAQIAIRVCAAETVHTVCVCVCVLLFFVRYAARYNLAPGLDMVRLAAYLQPAKKTKA